MRTGDAHCFVSAKIIKNYTLISRFPFFLFYFLKFYSDGRAFDSHFTQTGAAITAPVAENVILTSPSLHAQDFS